MGHLLIDASFLILGSLLVIPALSPAPIQVLTRWYPQRQITALHLGLRTRWFITGLFVVSLLLGKPIVLSLFGFAAFWAIKEQFSTMPTRRADRRTLFLIYMLIPIQMFFIANGWELLSVFFLPVFVLVVLPLLMWSVEKRNFYDALMLLQWSILTTIWVMSVAATLWIEPLKANPILAGGGLMIYLLGLTQLNIIIRRNIVLRKATS